MQTPESVYVRGLLQVLEEDSRPGGALRRLWWLSLLLRLQRKAWEQTVHSDAAWLLCSQRHVAHGGQGQASFWVTWMIPTPGLPNYPSECFFKCSYCSVLSLSQYLPKHLHIVCVDMPGHEGTTRTNTDDYSIHGQVRRIRQVYNVWINWSDFWLFH